jgi:hypothetical protein
MRPLGRLKCGWEENTKREPQEMGYSGMDWIELAQDRGKWCVNMNSIMNFRVP